MFHFLCFDLKMNANAERSTEYCTSLRNRREKFKSRLVAIEDLSRIYCVFACIVRICSNIFEHTQFQFGFFIVYLNLPEFYWALYVFGLWLKFLAWVFCEWAQAFAWYMCHALFSVDMSNSLAMDYCLNRFDQFGFSCARACVCVMRYEMLFKALPTNMLSKF